MHSKYLMGGMAWCAMGLAACTNAPVEVGANKPVKTEAPLMVNKVDILLVVDNSASMQGLQSQLPSLLDKLVAGSDKAGHEFPALTDVHLAVVSTDMGLSGVASTVPGCTGLGDDGVFITLSSEDLDACNVETPSYLTYDGMAANAGTVETVACIPALGAMGCGFEQPLESALKSLWPADDSSVEFLSGTGHGADENAGFLRQDSLLIVMVVSDEDDCSAEDPLLFGYPGSDELMSVDVNLRCPQGGDYLYDVQRYVDGLKQLRAEGSPVLFVALGGIPADLVDAEAQAAVDFSDADAVDAFYDGVLGDARMQIAVDPNRPEGQGNIIPSCTVMASDGVRLSYPPRRLVKVAKAFGKAGVLGSICAEDFADTMGGVIRAAADNL